MKKKIKDIWSNTNKWAFWTCLVTSIILITISFAIPPAGIIHPSVLQAVGELFGFATLGTVIDGVSRGSDLKVRKGDVEVHIDNPDK